MYGAMQKENRNAFFALMLVERSIAVKTNIGWIIYSGPSRSKTNLPGADKGLRGSISLRIAVL